jgi:CDP-glycerol glycerophosphotransferase
VAALNLVYNSYAGAFSDSPRAIFEALRDDPGHRHVWLSSDRHRAAFPPGVETVPYGSPEAVAALEAADVVVANTHTDFEWSKRPETLYLQTWHGTPLKRVHKDILWSPPGLHDRQQLDVDRWDVLLSPNRASTARLRQAFRYDREVLETGYPRNDVLSSPHRDDLRAAVRRRLGIADGVRAVLYAPTWRDADRFDLRLDLGRLADALGDDHVMLLRAHQLVAASVRADRHPGVIDVSGHAEVRDLYLAADVLITDYSSVMFDFAVTGRPILLFTYDLDHYRDDLRGFYFDLEREAPGPLLTDANDVVAALRDLDRVAAAHADRYRRFAERFCALEDGHAGARVVDAVFAAG